MGVGLQFFYYANPLAAVFTLLTNRGQQSVALLRGRGVVRGAMPHADGRPGAMACRVMYLRGRARLLTP